MTVDASPPERTDAVMMPNGRELALDASPVHLPASGRTLAARLPAATPTIEKRAGGAILRSARPILERLIAHR